jgi:hypothetical protein
MLFGVVSPSSPKSRDEFYDVILFEIIHHPECSDLLNPMCGHLLRIWTGFDFFHGNNASI